eukprot:412765_1
MDGYICESGVFQDYLEDVLPLVGFISLLTPLAAVDESIEKLPSWAIPLRMVSLDLPKKTLERHFIFSEKALKNGRYYTLFTHLLLQEDYEQFLKNLVRLVLQGYSVYVRMGRSGLLGIFVAGGVLAALDRKTKAVQLSNFMSSVLTSMDEVWFGVRNGLPPVIKGWFLEYPLLTFGDSISPWVEQAGDQVAKGIFRIVSPHVGCLGCSSGVSALAGANFVISVEEAITAILEFKLTSKNICRVARIFFIFMANRTEYLTLLGRVRNMDSASMNVNAGRLAGFGAGLAMYLGWRGFCMLHNSNKQRQRPRSMSGMNS